MNSHIAHRISHIALVLLFAGTVSAAPTLFTPAADTQIAVLPKTVTPNGDGINDTVFFYVLNKTAAPVKGEIFSLHGGKIADMKERTDITTQILNYTVLQWDAKDDSNTIVTGGIYFYKIEVGDRKLTGTLAVAK
jgi:hypothetical protein